MESKVFINNKGLLVTEPSIEADANLAVLLVTTIK